MSINLELPKKPGVFITGTDFGVGKTLIAGAIAGILTETVKNVGVFKPIATGCHRSWDGLTSYDTEFLAYCANSELPVSTITPISYLTRSVPIISAAIDKSVINFDKIATAYKKICQDSNIVIVE